jgi:hypothetical protein
VTDGALHSLPFDTNLDTNVRGTWRYSADRRSVSRWRTWLTLAEYTDAAITSERWASALIRKRSLVRVQAGPLQKVLDLQVKRRFTMRPWSVSRALVQQRGFALRKRGLHRPHGLFPHARQEVRVSVEGHGNGSVS